MTATHPSALLDVYARLDLEIVRGEGSELVASDGRRFLDFYAGHAVSALGYGHPALVAALDEQARTLFFQSNLVPSKTREEVAARLAALVPIDGAKVFFCNSGAEATENALRVACRATGRGAIVAVGGGFHGRTAAAAAVSDRSDRWYGFPRAPFDVRRVPFDDVEALSSAIDGDVAAVIVEPVQGIAGARALSDAWMRRARELTRAAGALLIADEVQCGTGRCGTFFGVEGSGVRPDLIALAKGIAGGFPAGVLLVGGELAARLGPGDLGSTFGGAPLAVAAIAATLDVVAEPAFLARVAEKGARLDGLAGLGPVLRVQGRGLLRGLVCSRPAKEILPALRERGILAGGSDDAAVVRLTPPLVIEDRHLDALADALREIPS